MGDQTPDVLLFRLAESAYHTTLTKDYGHTSTYGYVTSYIHTIEPNTPSHLGRRKTVSTEMYNKLHIEANLTLIFIQLSC